MKDLRMHLGELVLAIMVAVFMYEISGYVDHTMVQLQGNENLFNLQVVINARMQTVMMTVDVKLVTAPRTRSG